MDKIDVFPDMIGFLCKVDTPAPSGANQSKRVILHICMEEGINLRLTIWDALVDSFATKFREIDERNIVIIATSILPKSFGGKLCLSASSSTKIYLNGDFEVVKDFRSRHNVYPEIEDGESKNNDPNEYSIAEILSFISHEKEQVKEFFCKAKITEVVLHNGWNYISCSKCFRKMEKANSSLNCSNCNDSHSVAVLRFRLEVEVDDGRDCTTFVIFDKDAKQLTKPTAAELMAKNRENTVQDGRDRAPTSVLNIVGKTYKFQVKVTPYNFRAKYQSFTVSRIMNITDPVTEEHLQKKISVIEEAESSSSPTLGKIKIEGVGEEKKTGKGSKVSVKRRKV
ncbi:hypothetical protein ACS0TY_000176 [Phlomoides rotata]